MVRTYVFDIDNTLFDTSKIILDCYQRSLDEIVGPGLTINSRASQVLMSGGTWDRAWREIPGLTEQQAVKVRETKQVMYRQRVTEIRPFHSTLLMFRSLVANSRVLIWSNSERDVVLTLLQSVGISVDLVTIIERPSPANRKPSAIGLLSFLEKEAISPDSVCVIDDSSETIENISKHGISSFLWSPGII